MRIVITFLIFAVLSWLGQFGVVPPVLLLWALVGTLVIGIGPLRLARLLVGLLFSFRFLFG